jgi:hypothetical protein
VVQYSQRSVHQSRSGCIFLLFSLLGRCMEDFSSLEIGNDFDAYFSNIVVKNRLLLHLLMTNY